MPVVGSGSATRTVATPAGVVEGDWLLLWFPCFHNGNNNSSVDGSGWTNHGSVDGAPFFQGTNTGNRFYVFSKIVGAGEESETYTVTLTRVTGIAGPGRPHLLAYRGVNNDPLLALQNAASYDDDSTNMSTLLTLTKTTSANAAGAGPFLLPYCYIASGGSLFPPFYITSQDAALTVRVATEESWSGGGRVAYIMADERWTTASDFPSRAADFNTGVFPDWPRGLVARLIPTEIPAGPSGFVPYQIPLRMRAHVLPYDVRKQA